MEIERAGLLVLSIVAAVVLSSIAWKMFRVPGIHGTKAEVLSAINSYAEKCLSMGYGDCFVVDVSAEDSITPEDVSALSGDFRLLDSIKPGNHRLKFANEGGKISIRVVE